MTAALRVTLLSGLPGFALQKRHSQRSGSQPIVEPRRHLTRRMGMTLLGSSRAWTAAAGWLATAVCLAGCGSQTSAPGDNDPSPSPAEPRAVQVRVEVSGGLAGFDTSVVVRAGEPGSTDVLGQATALATAAPEGEPPGPTVPCCDRISYALTINLDDGSTVETSTYDGDDSPSHDLVLAVVAELTPTPEIPPDPR